MILYLALFHLLLCAVYSAIYLIGRRPFALAMAIAWGAAWLASLTYGTEVAPEEVAHAVTFLVSGTSFWMALSIIRGRKALPGSISAPVLLATLLMRSRFLSSFGIDLSYAVSGLAVLLIGSSMLSHSTAETFASILGSGTVDAEITDSTLSIETENLLEVGRKSKAIILIAAVTLILYGLLLLAPARLFVLSANSWPFLLGAVTRGIHLIALTSLLVLWLQRVEELLRRESVLEEVTTLAAVIEHDLRTPLSIMRQSLSLLRRGSHNQEKIARQISRLEDQIERIGSTIDILPSFSRAKLAVLKGREPVSLERVIYRSVELVLSEVSEPNSRFRMHLPPQETFVRADEGQLVNVTTNLLRNSLEATDPDTQNPIHIHLQVLKNTREVAITIRDHGKGISPEVLRRLGEPYISDKVSEGRPRGLGIYVATRLLRFNGGRLEFDSDGLTFSEVRVVLPLIDTQARAMRASVASADASGSFSVRSGRCLIIDDDEAFLKATTEWLESTTGMNVVAASSLEKAADLLPLQGVKAVVVDQRLSAESQATGEQWLFDNLPRLSGVRLLLLTGYPGAIRDYAKLAGAGVEILEKGRDEQRLQDILLQISRDG